MNALSKCLLFWVVGRDREKEDFAYIGVYDGILKACGTTFLALKVSKYPRRYARL